MSSGCGDVLSLADLQTAKKHQLFEAEVITGKQGGVAGGTNIDYATNQVTGQTQKTLPAVLRDSGFQPASFDFSTGGTLNATDRDKVVYDPVSKTWYSWSGALPKIIAAGTNPLLDTDWTPRTDPNIREDLSSAADGKGDALITVKKTGAGSVSRTQHSVNEDLYWVEDFGAIPDTPSANIAAVTAMLSALGYARFQCKTYDLTGFKFSGDSLVLLGSGMPHYIGGVLTGGTILKGMLDHSVKNARIENLGHIAVTDGIVINSGISPQTAGSLHVKNVTAIGTGESSFTHAQLYQGFNVINIDNVSGNDARYGVVVKSRGGFIRSVRGKNLSTAGLFLKGDTGVPAANVTDGSAANIVVEGVDIANSSSNTSCAAFYIQSSTNLASKILANNIKSVNGRSTLEIAGGGTGALQTNAIVVSNIMGEATSNSTFVATGNPSDFIVKGILSINPGNGSAFTVSGSSANGMVGDVTLIISNTAITSTLAGFIDGTAMRLGDVNVRNPYRNMVVQIGRSRVTPGTLTGNVTYQGDGNIAVVNSAAWGSVIPYLETRNGNIAAFHGSIITTSVTIANSPTIGTLPFSYPVSTIVEVSIKLRDGNYSTTRMYVSGTVLQLLTSSGTSIAEVYLEGVTLAMPKI